MLKALAAGALALGFSWSVASFGADYNFPKGDKQYEDCLKFADQLGWQGGADPSPVAGQTKKEAFCVCMWNETPDNFKGELATFAESPKGKETNALCEKHSNWHS